MFVMKTSEIKLKWWMCSVEGVVFVGGGVGGEQGRVRPWLALCIINIRWKVCVPKSFLMKQTLCT